MGGLQACQEVVPLPAQFVPVVLVPHHVFVLVCICRTHVHIDLINTDADCRWPVFSAALFLKALNEFVRSAARHKDPPADFYTRFLSHPYQTLVSSENFSECGRKLWGSVSSWNVYWGGNKGGESSPQCSGVPIVTSRPLNLTDWDLRTDLMCSSKVVHSNTSGIGALVLIAWKWWFSFSATLAPVGELSKEFINSWWKKKKILNFPRLYVCLCVCVYVGGWKLNDRYNSKANGGARAGEIGGAAQIARDGGRAHSAETGESATCFFFFLFLFSIHVKLLKMLILLWLLCLSCIAF